MSNRMKCKKGCGQSSSKARGQPCRMTGEGIEPPVGAALTELEAAIGHHFARPELLVCVLTHRSLANQQAQEAGGFQTLDLGASA